LPGSWTSIPRPSPSGWPGPDISGGAQPRRPSKLEPFKSTVARLLAQHPFTAQQVFQRLREGGYAGGYTILADHVRQVRPAHGPAFLTLQFAPGQCAQVDWGSAGWLRVGATRRRLSFFVMVLCYSRRLFVEFTLAQTQEHFLAGHQHAFEYFGGVSAEVTHYRREVTLGEDACRAAHRQGAAVLASLRNLAIGVYELERERERTRVDTLKSWCQQQTLLNRVADLAALGHGPGPRPGRPGGPQPLLRSARMKPWPGPHRPGESVGRRNRPARPRHAGSPRRVL
jgi:hypothetical protein